jgi:hypothetical protein
MKEGPPETLAACYVRLGQTQHARDTLAAFLKENPDWVASDATVIPIAADLQQRRFDDIRAAGGVGKPPPQDQAC